MYLQKKASTHEGRGEEAHNKTSENLNVFFIIIILSRGNMLD